MGVGWGRAQQWSAQDSGPLSGWKLGSGLGLLGDVLREGLGGPPCFPTLGAVGDRAACGRPQVRAAHPPALPQGEPRPSVTEVQAQLTHLQEGETGSETGNDGPRVTQPARGGAELGSRPSGQDSRPWGGAWECPQFLVSSLGAPSIFRHNKRHSTQASWPLRSSAAPSFYSRGALGLLLGLSL